MDGIECKSMRFFLPASADKFVGGEAAESLESFGEVVGSEEVAEVNVQLLMAVVVVALTRAFFDGAVHTLDQAVSPGMVRFGQPVVDAMPKTDPVKRMAAKAGRWSLAILRQIGELDAVVGEQGVDAIRNSRDQSFEESRRSLHVGTFDQLHESKLRGAVDGHKEIELALRSPHFRQIDVGVADRIALELLPSRLAAFHFRQPADAMPFQTTMQGGKGQMGNGPLKAIETIIERQQIMSAEGNNDSFFLHRQNRGAGLLRPGTKIDHRAALPPLRNGLGVDPMTTR